MDALPVLVLDYENQSMGCIGFLLQLAGFSVSEVTNIAEALNLAIYHLHTKQQFGLLAINNLPDAEVIQAIRLLHRAGVTLPLLLTNRKIPVNRGNSYEPSQLGNNVFFCRPEQIGPAARSITTPEATLCRIKQRNDIV